ncbi:MAG: chorismate synthase [Bacteroidales bacterium]|nr:chorismate synthase [Candidatus Cryptobacteroides faecihippi]MCQ2162907.1 chorismate synthase [Bacteroidales bacterium]
MNSFGNNFKVSIFGESHGTGIGIVVDGVRAGISLCTEDLMADILRRKSGAKGTTPRVEADEPEFLSGVFEGHTTGSPIAIIFRNGNTRSSDYEALKAVPRPGHADYVAGVKWDGFNDPRGGGHFSGRITLPVVAAGVIAKKMSGMDFSAELIEIGGETDKARWSELLDRTSKEGDSIGGIVECTVSGVPAGLGEPFFDSAEALLSHAMFSIPGVRGVEFGDGFAAARMKGSEHNDPLVLEDGAVRTVKNGAGGINGGITNGAQIKFRVAFKPTASICREQKTLNVKTGEMVSLNVPGRHDVCFALRTPVIVEAMAAIVLADLAARK